MSISGLGRQGGTDIVGQTFVSVRIGEWGHSCPVGQTFVSVRIGEWGHSCPPSRSESPGIYLRPVSEPFDAILPQEPFAPPAALPIPARQAPSCPALPLSSSSACVP